jgi:hypothetical protein
MYQAIQTKRLITILGGLAVLVFIVMMCFTSSDSVLEWLKHVSAAASVTAIIVVGLGNKWVFHPIWRLKPVQALLFPYVAGEWHGTVSSNWPVVKIMMTAFTEGGPAHPAAELDVNQTGTLDKPIKVTVEADLFRISMRLQTLEDYSTSHTLLIKPQRHGLRGLPRLLYIYQNDTQVPVNTDTAGHFGAAYLDVECNGGAMTLAGPYWTGRNWTKGLNTAGRIMLVRPASS